MAFWNKFPFTNFHEMNLDWLISTMKELTDGFNVLDNSVKQQLKDFNTTMTNTLTSQNTKINDFVNNYEAKVNDIPNQVLKDVRIVMHDYETAGVFQEIIKDTYGAVNYLNVLQDKNVVVLGDSLSADRNGVSWVNNLKTMTKGVLNITNYAVSNAKLADQAEKYSSYSGKVDILVVWCGINDVRDQTSLEDVRTALESIRTKTLGLNKECQIYLFSTYKNLRGMKTNWIIPQTAYWRYFNQYCTSEGWTFVDLFSSAPIISTISQTMLNYYFTETDKGYLHYNEKYSPILARYILNVLVSQSPVPLGDYFERITGTNLNANCSPVTSVFSLNTNGSYVDFGTRFIRVHIAGTFTAPNTAPQYTKILTLPSCFRPSDNSNYAIAFRAGGVGSDGGQYSAKALLNSDGAVYLFNQYNENTSKVAMTCFVDFKIDNWKYNWKRTAE